jgi:hypothetical protein
MPMPRTAKILLMILGSIIAVMFAVIVWFAVTSENHGGELTDYALKRLKSGPFDEDVTTDELLQVFHHQGGHNATSIYASKFLRVTGRYYDATRNPDGDLVVVAGMLDRSSDAGVFCAYIGPADLVHSFHRGQTMTMHALGAAEVHGAVGLASCVIEPP